MSAWADRGTEGASVGWMRCIHGEARDGNGCSRAESQAAPACFARARATAPTNTGIFPISKWLMRLRLDARMSNLFYWMYTLAPPPRPSDYSTIDPLCSVTGIHLLESFPSPLSADSSIFSLSFSLTDHLLLFQPPW